MKKLTCELCGSADIIKKDGVFTCENCGTKYTLEEAKKMLVEGVVNVQGVVQVDDSNRLSNYFIQAKTAYETGEIDKAKEYCDKILENNANYEQAWLLKGKICFKNEYKASITYYKNAVNIALKQGEEAHKELLKQINDNICEYFENVCDQYNLLGFIKSAKQHIQIVNDYTQIDKNLSLDIERIKNKFEKFIEEQFDLNRFFIVRKDFIVFDNNSSYWRYDIHPLLSQMINLNLITDKGYAHIAKNISDFATIAVNKIYDIFCSANFNNHGTVYKEYIENFNSVLIGTLDLMYLFYDKADAALFTEGYNTLKEIYPRLLETTWRDNGENLSYTADFKNAVENKMFEIGSKIKPAVNIEEILEEPEIEENSEEWEYVEDEKEAITVICEKCQKEFSYKQGDEIYDDEKESITCPECGHINLKKDIKEIKTEEDKKSFKGIINFIIKLLFWLVLTALLLFTLQQIDIEEQMKKYYFTGWMGISNIVIWIMLYKLVTKDYLEYEDIVKIICQKNQKYIKILTILFFCITEPFTIFPLDAGREFDMGYMILLAFIIPPILLVLFVCTDEKLRNKQLNKLCQNGAVCSNCKQELELTSVEQLTLGCQFIKCTSCGKSSKINALQIHSHRKKRKKTEINNTEDKHTNTQQNTETAAQAMAKKLLIFLFISFISYVGFFLATSLYISNLMYIIAIFAMLVPPAKISQSYTDEADSIRNKYFTNHLAEFRKYNISESAAKKIIGKNKANDDATIFGMVFLSALIIGIIGLIFFFSTVAEQENKDGIEVFKGIIILFWGFGSSIIGILIASHNIEGRVYASLEKSRCPHCKAPLSYHLSKTYTDNEHHFQKKVKKRDYQLQMDFVETQNWVKYDEHTVYSCSYCKKSDNNVRTVEKRVDKTGGVLSDILS